MSSTAQRGKKGQTRTGGLQMKCMLRGERETSTCLSLDRERERRIRQTPAMEGNVQVQPENSKFSNSQDELGVDV